MLEKLPDVLGHALRNQRAGLDSIAFNRNDLRQGTSAITVASLAFVDHAPIPALYTADGDGRSPPLQWSGVPADTGSVVVLVEDADAPTPRPLVHAIVVDLPGADGILAEGALSGGDGEDATSDVRDGAVAEEPRTGKNSYLQSEWLPPDPPPGHGQHRYAFQVFALKPGAVFSDNPGRDEVLGIIASHGIASGLLIGTYERDNSVHVDDALPVGARGPIPA